jgi:DNA repair protein RecO (recombination protein O)
MLMKKISLGRMKQKMKIQTPGLIIKETNIGENDKLLVILTKDHGIIRAFADGVRRMKSKNAAATSLLCYSDFVLYGQGDKYWIKECSLIESFFGIRNSIEGLALAGYIVEVLSDVGVEDKEVDLLRLALNSLYAISSQKYDLNKVKAVFEMRALSILGFMPEVVSCHTCARNDGDFFFDIMAGAIECFDCHKKSTAAHETLSEEHEGHIVSIISEGAKIAMCYAIYSPLEKIFSFNISDEDMRLFSKAAERYLVNHLERTYKSLEFYNEVKR